MLLPPPSLLCKLASIVVHTDEMLSPGGHEFDRVTLDGLLADKEVTQWIAQMARAAMAPVKRLSPTAEKALREIRAEAAKKKSK